MADTLDLYTTLVNTSGVARFFGYIGRHGKTIPPGGQVTVFGHNFFGQYGFNLRKQQSFERDLVAGKIQVLSTPRPILHDSAPSAQTAAPSTALTITPDVTSGVAGVANPTTQATVAATGGGATGGLLAAGTYYVKYTFVNAAGETTAGTSESAQVTVGATNIPRVTLPSLPNGANSINLYATPANGAQGTEVLYATGIKTTTYDMAVAAPVSTVQPPSGNTTSGLLPVGQYQIGQTFVTSNGETTLGPASATFSVTAQGQIVKVAIPQLTGSVTSCNLYIAVAPPGIISDPTTQATASATGGGSTGGALAAGTYYIKYSFVDAFGETLAGGESAQLTVAAGNIPRVTLPALPAGATSINVYLTPVNGAAGTEILYGTGITATTFDMSYQADPFASAPPAFNSTGGSGSASPGSGRPRVFQKIATAVGSTSGSSVWNIADAFPAYSDSLLPPAFNQTGGKSNRGVGVSNGTLGAVDPSWGALRDA